jgi:uncharacterized membrane protein
MAGIGFELRKILRKDSFWSVFRAYGYAGVISSGPWILSILGLLVIGLSSVSSVALGEHVAQFQISVTYLIATSLILTGFIQSSFTRFVADRLFEKHDGLVLPNFHGVVSLVTVVTALVGTVAVLLLFPTQSIIYRVLMVGSFVVLANVWVGTIFLSGLKQYQGILVLFAIGYGITVGAARLCSPYGLEGLLFGFFLGQFVLLLGIMGLTFKHYSSADFWSCEFLKKGKLFRELIWLGFFYNAALWVDKLLFWYFPHTGQLIIGPLKSSPIYDLPIFLAYLAILPGMASFLVRMETDFVDRHAEFYEGVRNGASLDYIEEAKSGMVRTARQGLYEIMKIQFVVCLICWWSGPTILSWLGISMLYESLLYIDVVAASLQVVFLGILNTLFYLDKRALALRLTIIFFVSNGLLTLATLMGGMTFYGYGFAGAVLLAVVVGMYQLDKTFHKLEFETFMLQ